MTFIKVSIELYEDNTMRIRLYANTTQSGKLIDEHLDESKPNWYLLFSEATIYSIDETTFTPTENTKIGEIHMS